MKKFIYIIGLTAFVALCPLVYQHYCFNSIKKYNVRSEFYSEFVGRKFLGSRKVAFSYDLKDGNKSNVVMIDVYNQYLELWNILRHPSDHGYMIVSPAATFWNYFDPITGVHQATVMSYGMETEKIILVNNAGFIERVYTDEKLNNDQ